MMEPIGKATFIGDDDISITMQSRFWTASVRNCPTGIPPVFVMKS